MQPPLIRILLDVYVQVLKATDHTWLVGHETSEAFVGAQKL